MSFNFTPQQPSLFQTQNNTVLQQQQQQQQQQFQLQQQQLQFQQQQQQQLFLFTNDKAPASYGTKWADLHPDSQKFLLQIEERILEYRGESQRLDQCSRLYDSLVSNDGFELDASLVVQELGGISMYMERQKALLRELTSTVKDMLRNTEMAVRSFMILRPRFIHPNTGATSSATAPSQGPASTIGPSSSGQPQSTAMVPVFDFYSGLPKKPSPFLQQTVTRFDKYLGECRQWIEELEQLLLLNSDRNSVNSTASLLQSLPQVMSNVHDFFVHVAAKVESIHQYMESMKSAYLADQRRRGEGNDPFLEADRRETAKQKAAARRVHPTIHLPANSQPSTQVAVLFSSSATLATSAAPQTSLALPAASSGTGLFSTPTVATSSSLFSTPSLAATPQTSLFGTTSTPQTSLFGPTSTPQTSLFGQTTTPQTSLFGQTSTPQTSLFGQTSTPQTSLFNPTSTPTVNTSFGGTSIGNTSKPRAKSRTGRR
jgi:nucleoporin p58/p45